MPSHFSPSLKLELIATGEQAGTWGATTNMNLGTLIEQAITGVAAIVLTGDYTLTNLDGTSDEARNAVLVFTGAPAANSTVTIPAQNKVYIVNNNTSPSVNLYIQPSGGTAYAVAGGTTQLVYCDGSAVYALNKPVYTFAEDVTMAKSLTVGENATFGYAAKNGTYAQSLTTITVTSTAHGLSAGDSVYATFTGGATSGTYTVATTPTVDTLTLTSGSSGSFAGSVVLDSTVLLYNPRVSVPNGVTLYGDVTFYQALTSFARSIAVTRATSLGEVRTTGTYTQVASTTVTVTAVSHGRQVDDSVYLKVENGTLASQAVTVLTVPTADSFTCTVVASGTTSGDVTLYDIIQLNGVISNEDSGIPVFFNSSIGLGTEDPQAKLDAAMSTGGTIAVTRLDTSVITDDRIGSYSAYGIDTTSNVATELTRIGSYADGDHAAGDNPTRLDVYVTKDGTDTLGKALSVTNSGAIQSCDPGTLGTLYPMYAVRAWAKFDGTTTANLSGTYTATGGSATDGVYVVSVRTDADHFQATKGAVTITVAVTGHNAYVGNQLYVNITSGTTSGNVTLNFTALTAGGNVANISKVSTGTYIVNFITPMPTANFAAHAMGSGNVVFRNAATYTSTASAELISVTYTTGWAVADSGAVSTVTISC